MLEDYLKEITTCSKLTSIGLLEVNAVDGQKMAFTSLTSNYHFTYNKQSPFQPWFKNQDWDKIRFKIQL